MRPPTLIAMLAVAVLVLSATLAYRIGYQRGSLATLEPAASEASRLDASRDGIPGRTNTVAKPAQARNQARRPTADVPVAANPNAPATADVADDASTQATPASIGHGLFVPGGNAPGPVGAPEGRLAITFRAGTNSLIRIQGTSTIGDWEVRSSIVGGSLEVDRSFPLAENGARLGRVPARAVLRIPVRSLRSVLPDGTPYNTRMDDNLYEKLLRETHPSIEFSLSQLTRLETAEGEALQCEARGTLALAGVTNEITLPLVVDLAAASVHFRGELTLRMSDFGIELSSKSASGGGLLIKTGDEVRLSLDWNGIRRRGS